MALSRPLSDVYSQRRNGLRIDKLTADYLDVAEATYQWNDKIESPALLKLNGRYYMFGSRTSNPRCPLPLPSLSHAPETSHTGKINRPLTLSDRPNRLGPQRQRRQHLNLPQIRLVVLDHLRRQRLQHVRLADDLYPPLRRQKPKQPKHNHVHGRPVGVKDAARVHIHLAASFYLRDVGISEEQTVGLVSGSLVFRLGLCFFVDGSARNDDLPRDFEQQHALV